MLCGFRNGTDGINIHMQFDEKYESLMNEYAAPEAVNEGIAKKAIKGTAKLAGKSALAFADFMTGGDVSKGIDFVKSSYEDAENDAEDTVELTLPKELAEILHELLMVATSEEEDAEKIDKERMK